MLLTQTAAGSEVEATVQDTVDTITGFNKFIQEKGPDLIAFGIRILMALLIFIICHKAVSYTHLDVYKRQDQQTGCS